MPRIKLRLSLSVCVTTQDMIDHIKSLTDFICRSRQYRNKVYVNNNNNNNRFYFYGPLIQNNPGEQVPETIGHINPHYHHYPPQYN